MKTRIVCNYAVIRFLPETATAEHTTPIALRHQRTEINFGDRKTGIAEGRAAAVLSRDELTPDISATRRRGGSRDGRAGGGGAARDGGLGVAVLERAPVLGPVGAGILL